MVEPYGKKAGVTSFNTGGQAGGPIRVVIMPVVSPTSGSN